MTAGAHARAGPAFERFPLLAAGMLSLVVGVLAGLMRAGFAMPIVGAGQVAVHGALMIGAFLGTVISLERAVALGTRWGYVGPVLSSIAAVLLWTTAPVAFAASLQFVAGIALVAVSARLNARQPALHSRVLVIAAACWPAGTVLWLLGGDAGAASVGWTAFLVLTIAAERLELSRFMPRTPGALRGFLLGLAACVLAVAISAVAPLLARAVFGAACVVLAAWMWTYDIARRTARQPGLTGYIGRCLLAGYFWLAVAGLLLGASALPQAPALLNDAAWHAVLLGFVISMVFGHAPVILPAVLGIRMLYHPVFYLPVVLLHGSLALRVAGGLATEPHWRAAGAAGSAIALLAFVAVVVSAAVRGARARRSATSSRS